MSGYNPVSPFASVFEGLLRGASARDDLARQQAQDAIQQQLQMAQLANYQRQADQVPLDAARQVRMDAQGAQDKQFEQAKGLLGLMLQGKQYDAANDFTQGNDSLRRMAGLNPGMAGPVNLGFAAPPVDPATQARIASAEKVATTRANATTAAARARANATTTAASTRASNARSGGDPATRLAGLQTKAQAFALKQVPPSINEKAGMPDPVTASRRQQVYQQTLDGWITGNSQPRAGGGPVAQPAAKPVQKTPAAKAAKGDHSNLWN